MNKVAIFGIDGASLSLIEQWKDELPNLRKIMEGGVYGELESTIPPVTCPAWPCMFTGKNPGKLGMYGFTTIKPTQQQDLQINNSSKYHSASLWKILNDYGKDVGLLNIPMTFPPHSINKFMVCGVGAPESRTSSYTYPLGLKKVLDKVTGGYEIWTPLASPFEGTDKDRYIKAVEDVVDKRLKAAKHLISNFDLDLFICVFWAIDQIQHYFWHYMDETHPKHQVTKYKGVIKDFYTRIDSAIGNLIEEIPRDTNILVVSDHGFGSTYGSFLVNQWMEAKGFLNFRRDVHHNKLSGALYKIRKLLLSHINPNLARLLLKLTPKPIVKKFAVLNEQKNQILEVYKSIDWPQTKAYGCGSMGMISVNLKGRDPQGIVEDGEEFEMVRNRIIEELRNLVNPNTGEPLSVRVFKREELYHGCHASEAPDIVFSIDKYLQTLTAEPVTQWLREGDIKYLGWTGWHVQQGTFVAYGPDIKSNRGKMENLKIYDITPTVLHMFGLPVPDDIDGRVLTEIFKTDSEPAIREVIHQATRGKHRVKDKISKLKKSGKI